MKRDIIQVKVEHDLSEKVNYDHHDHYSYIRRALLSCYPDYAALSHWHEDVEFIYILDGTMDYCINSETVTLRKDDGLFVNARQLHHGFSREHNECDFLCIILHPSLLCITKEIAEEFVTPIISRGQPAYILLKNSTDWQAEINALLCEMYFSPDEKAQKLKIQYCFNKIWMLLYDNISAEREVTGHNYHAIGTVRDILSYIDAHYTEKLSVAEIAASVHISESACFELFRRYIGQTPSQYMMRLRLEKSIELMQKDMTISEIAYAVGFSGASYFSEVFKRFYGMTPREFRAEK